jgi:hypothetical protein
MSFYKGLVAKLICHCVHDNTSEWKVVDILNIDSTHDSNMHLDLSNGPGLRAALLPVTQIHGFDLTTNTVVRQFNLHQHSEHWSASK